MWKEHRSPAVKQKTLNNTVDSEWRCPLVKPSAICFGFLLSRFTGECFTAMPIYRRPVLAVE